jgi:hypothetical protein
MRGPSEVKWRTPDNQTDNWSFAASSVDPLEPLENIDLASNGTVVGEGHAAALLDFTPPAQPFTLSVDVSPIQTLADGVYVGFTSSGVLVDNFASFGSVWMSVNGFGQWELWANGTTGHLASGAIGVIDCVVASECGVATSASVQLIVGSAGDAVRNGQVNFADVMRVLAHWGLLCL